jgi:hypothetical protein
MEPEEGERYELPEERCQPLGRQHNETPQSQPIPGSAQVPNSAGGYAWAVDDWTRLHRFWCWVAKAAATTPARVR